MVETSPRQEETLLVNLRSGQHGVDSQKPRCLETPPPLLGRGPRVATMPIRRLDGPTLQGYPGRIIPILLVCTTPWDVILSHSEGGFRIPALETAAGC
jgi:hypothetical protein